MLGINDLAPEFTLKNTSKEDVSLSDFTDKTVLKREKHRDTGLS